jgi:NADH:ubiquinone oxidoreductase subunit H
MQNLLFYFLNILEHLIGTLLPVLITIAFYTLIERKVIATVQRRKGPNVVGFEGILQPIADGAKLFLKEFIIPKKSNLIFFIYSPIYTFVFHLVI